ncbi:MAG: hypothetical protein AAFW64_00425 [Pseudomonadota bacterium]
MSQVYVSVTGLKLNAFWHAPRFWRMAGAAMAAARAAPGNIKAGARTIRGVHHTLSVWEDRDAMVGFVHGPVHARAIEMFPDIAMGKTLGFHADTAPDWETAVARWNAEAKTYAEPAR